MNNRFTNFCHSQRLSNTFPFGLGIVLVLFTLLINPAFLQAQDSSDNRYISDVWVADNGDDTYTNPIIHADYSNPVVVRADYYYKTASSFNTVPELPILHSKDLVNGELIDHALPTSTGLGLVLLNRQQIIKNIK